MASTIPKKVRSSADAKRIALRNNFWPGLDTKRLWIRTEKVGFTTIPRTMSLVGRIMNQLAGKGFPLSDTYLALWCRVFDEALVEVRNDRELAFESGFSGTRGVVTWRARMKMLQDLGFIDIRAGLASDFQYILLYNPILIIAETYQRLNIPQDVAYEALKVRLIEIGAAEELSVIAS
jgi:hypothetical protein